MFYPVRIFDSRGKLKKTLSSQEAEKLFWQKFYDEEKSMSLGAAGRKGLSNAQRKALNIKFSEERNHSFSSKH
ncbi:MAG: hypothetical protein HOJ79_02040 [Nitrospina sp.]|jgi:hypothetical protein|nr:hypothetical protein [Nitrospina sp.]